jgi:hypothetical protein
MELNVSHGHRAAHQKCRGHCRQTDHHQEATDELDDAADPDLREDGDGIRRGPEQPKLLRAMHGHQETGDDSEQGKGAFGMGGEIAVQHGGIINVRSFINQARCAFET